MATNALKPAPVAGVAIPIATLILPGSALLARKVGGSALGNIGCRR